MGNSIIGLGNDIIEIKRIEKAIKNKRFIDRVYTKNEISYIESKGSKTETYAGIFSAKESVAKALGTGFNGKKFHDIEILHDDLGKPYVNGLNALISISHSKEYVVTTAIILS